MGVIIEALKATYGDCIFVTIQDKESVYTIMIDGGTPNTYSFKNKKQKTEAGPLKHKLSELKKQGRCIDLLIVTHVDNDHIGGIIRWFEDDIPSPDFVKRIWMNDDVEINVAQGLENTSAQAASLKEFMQKHGLSFEDQWVKGREESFSWGRIIMLAPTAEQHNRISKDIAKGLENTVNDRYEVDIKSLIDEDYVCDNVSPENDASMAFLLQTNDGENCLFLGDANIDTILFSLSKMDDLKLPIPCKWVKLSHHGSKNNFKPELLALINAENYIFSTDGTRFGHPDKEVLAWIIDKTKARLWFNYIERAERIFTKQDRQNYTDLEERIKTF